MLVYVVFCCFFFFKQKTAYEMRISDWSSDVCSSDLLTTLGNPDLKPEKSRSWTVGALIEPIPGVSFTADYYNIKKTGAISAPNFAPAIAAYYTGQPIPDGYRSEEHTSELQSLMRISYAVFCLTKKTQTDQTPQNTTA